jgi:hypothetical protein
MKSIKTIIAAVLLACSTNAIADNYTYLTISGTDNETNFAVSDIQTITFDNTDMILKLTNGTTQRLPLSGLSKMFFTADPSGITTVEGAKSKIDINGGVLRANVAEGERITIYNLKGEAVYTSNADATVDLKTLVKGVYIVKVGQEAIKVMNR